VRRTDERKMCLSCERDNEKEARSGLFRREMCLHPLCFFVFLLTTPQADLIIFILATASVFNLVFDEKVQDLNTLQKTINTFFVVSLSYTI
jgi:hypothetical protein